METLQDPRMLTILICGWTGSALMCVAPFFIDSDFGKGCAIAGLSLLSVQAIAHRLHNLLLLNLIGVIGYVTAILHL